MYMKIWHECLKAGLSTNEARWYATVEIDRMVEKGELKSPDTKESLPNPVIPFEMEPLKPNPPHAPKKINQPKKARPSLNLPFLKPKPVLP